MAQRYLHRSIEPRLRRAAKHFPVLVLTGPRQTGKTTLLTRLFPKHRLITFDNRTLMEAARRDPAGFVEGLGTEPVLLDEIQYSPEILPYIKIAVDRNRGQAGRFLLTGSQMFSLMSGVAESLAGRAGLFELLPFSWEELTRKPPHLRAACYEQLMKGFYADPAIHRVPIHDYYGSYLATYLERDIRHIRSVVDLSRFQGFLELLAARVGSLLNVNDLARDAGISHATANQWLSVLESTRIIYLLRPYFRNITKRVVKHPKVYFTDTGLLAHLLKYPDAATLSAGPMAGAFFENMVILDFLKRKFSHGALFEMYFYRDSNDNEIDLILDFGLSKRLFEIKSTKSPSPALATSLARAKDLKSDGSYVVSFLDEPISLSDSTLAIPWWEAIELISPTAKLSLGQTRAPARTPSKRGS